MFCKLLRNAFGKRGPWAGMVNRDTIIYYDDDGRKMTIAGQMLNDGVEIYVASIVTWDDGRGGVISDAERQRILRNLVSSLESQGRG